MERLKIPSLAIRIGLAVGIIIIGIVIWSKVMARWGSGSPPAPYPADQQADLIVVNKAARHLVLIRQGRVIGRYAVSLGSGADQGAKRREGDKKTPEGRYMIDGRNPHSRFYLSLHISYPDLNDVQRGKVGGYKPGENIMIHGVPNGWGWLSSIFSHFDWTDGCIAVSNADMQEIWARVSTGVAITIAP